jgi:UDP-N-acetyl-D-galactosamine dehydrogenase
VKEISNLKIAVIGLGYVGLPLAVEFGRKRAVLGFDINSRRIDELKAGKDSTLEASSDELKSASYLTYTTQKEDLKKCDLTG